MKASFETYLSAAFAAAAAGRINLSKAWEAAIGGAYFCPFGLNGDLVLFFYLVMFVYYDFFWLKLVWYIYIYTCFYYLRPFRDYHYVFVDFLLFGLF